MLHVLLGSCSLNLTQPSVADGAGVAPALTNDMLGPSALSIAGGTNFAFQVDVATNGVAIINFHDHGIPKDAEILAAMWFTTTGAAPPVGFRRHNRLPYTRVDNPLQLHGVGGADETIQVVIMGAWAPRATLDEASFQLLGAVEAFVDQTVFNPQGDYQRIVLPANTAAEIALTRLAASLLRGSRDRFDDFLTTVGYSRVLNVLLPSLTERRIRPLPPDVLGSLRRLSRARNTVAHRGRLPTGLDRDSAAGYVTASYLATVYVEEAQPFID